MQKFITFKDIKALGIFTNWPSLLRAIEQTGFPPGVRLGTARRAWAEDEVKTWLVTRAVKPVVKADLGATV